MNYLSQLAHSYLKDKKCLLRLNLDIDEADKDSFRIKAAVPTLELLINNGCRPLVISHRGRPRGKDEKLSLKPVIGNLKHQLAIALGGKAFFDWLENLRFDPREQANDEVFAKELAARGDFFVNDDFATSHRENASLVQLPRQLPSFAGLILEKEISNLTKIKDEPKQPLVLIIGGVKTDDKIKVIKSFHKKARHFLLGSTYFGHQFPADLSDKVILPEDWVEHDEQKLDIGEKTIERYRKIIAQAGTIIWSGPLGQFEKPKYRRGSEEIAQAVAQSPAFSVVGGGATTKLLGSLGLLEQIGFVSTGGGAMLAFLAGEKLPGLEALSR